MTRHPRRPPLFPNPPLSQSIDLSASTAALPAPPEGAPLMTDIPRLRTGRVGAQFWSVWIPVATRGPEAVQMTLERSEEHTSELQSLAYLVCRLLLEKKNLYSRLLVASGRFEVTDASRYARVRLRAFTNPEHRYELLQVHRNTIQQPCQTPITHYRTT